MQPAYSTAVPIPPDMMCLRTSPITQTPGLFISTIAQRPLMVETSYAGSMEPSPLVSSCPPIMHCARKIS